MKAWKGRIDGTDEPNLRWHQVVRPFEENSQKNNPAGFWGILGFECDEGVRRNQGRVGAANSPDLLRNTISNFPAVKNQLIYDFGNITCIDQKLEVAQERLAQKVHQIHHLNGKSLLLGGGHEILFAHYSGLRKAYPDSKIGIINFDAHFDNRPINSSIGASSGTGFWQIAQQDENYSYLAIGIQENSNTKALFDFAEKNNSEYILAQNICYDYKEITHRQVSKFIDNNDIIYVTVCMDVFASAFAPGVSASAYNGLIPDPFFRNLFLKAIKSPKLKAFDVAEINPTFDIDNRTTKLAASLIFDLVKNA